MAANEWENQNLFRIWAEHNPLNKFYFKFALNRIVK